MKYLAWTPMSHDQETEPSQAIEMAVFESITEMGLKMPPVRQGWFGGGRHGGAFSSEQFPGSMRAWYWEV